MVSVGGAPKTMHSSDCAIDDVFLDFEIHPRKARRNSPGHSLLQLSLKLLRGNFLPVVRKEQRTPTKNMIFSHSTLVCDFQNLLFRSNNYRNVFHVILYTMSYVSSTKDVCVERQRRIYQAFPRVAWTIKRK